ncbi:MAG: GPW/gp25 family protein [Paracoccaceae bacterium]
MTILSRVTGLPITGLDVLREDIARILGTRTGSRLLRRDYGSDLPDRVGAPLNGETIAEIYADVAQALDRQMPELRLKRVELLDADADGRFAFRLDAAHPALDGPLAVTADPGGAT